MEEQPDFQNIRLAVPAQDPAPNLGARQVKKERYVEYFGALGLNGLEILPSET
jgi:hypothetical protein